MRDHGDRNRYLHGPDENNQPGKGCREDLCREAWNTYRQNRARLMAYGRWEPYVDAAPVRAHIESLGMPWFRIATLAGVSGVTVPSIMETDSFGSYVRQQVRPEAARKILAVRATLDDLSNGTVIDAIGTRRRAQAMAAIGYSMKEQADQIGRSQPNYRRILIWDQVVAETARRVRDLYNEWSMTPAPHTWVSERTRRWAASQGWLPPLAWDDDLIDLPDDVLKAKVREMAEAMTDRELNRCHTAYSTEGDKSPLTVAGDREYKRRYARRKVAS